VGRRIFFMEDTAGPEGHDKGEERDKMKEKRSQISHIPCLTSLVTDRKKSRSTYVPLVSSCTVRVTVCLPGLRPVRDQSTRSYNCTTLLPSNRCGAEPSIDTAKKPFDGPRLP
jgi:hypothetical protein